MAALSYVEGGKDLDKRLAEIAQKLGRGGALKVGFLEGATYPDGTSVGLVAALQNFGAPSRGIPPRPFFTNMVKDKSGAWPDQLGEILVSTQYDLPASLRLMGEGIAGQLRQSIVDTNAPALSPVTLMLRKMKSENQGLVITGRVVGEAAKRVAAGESYGDVSTKPLIDTGHLLASVDYEVTDEVSG